MLERGGAPFHEIGRYGVIPLGAVQALASLFVVSMVWVFVVRGGGYEVYVHCRDTSGVWV